MNKLQAIPRIRSFQDALDRVQTTKPLRGEKNDYPLRTDRKQSDIYKLVYNRRDNHIYTVMYTTQVVTFMPTMVRIYMGQWYTSSKTRELVSAVTGFRVSYTKGILTINDVPVERPDNRLYVSYAGCLDQGHVGVIVGPGRASVPQFKGINMLELLRKWREAHTAMRTFRGEDWRPERLALIEAIHKPVHELAMFIPPALGSVDAEYVWRQEIKRAPTVGSRVIGKTPAYVAVQRGLLNNPHGVQL